MEMVEDEIDKPKINPKRVKVEEIVEEDGEDRISLLPDGLLLEILSRLPSIKNAIRTGKLSKRWKYLWTWIPTLIFNSDYMIHPLSDIVSFVDQTLTQCRQPKLRKFVKRFELQVNNWIRYAISRKAEELDLSLYNYDSESGDLTDAFMLNEDFVRNSCFTDLKLSYCEFNPKGAIGWKRLRSLHLCWMNLDENLIENILTGSPLLETLVLGYCYGYRELDITSKNVKKLVLSGYEIPKDESWDYDDIIDDIEINAPHILSLTIEGHVECQKLLLLNVSSLVEAHFNFGKDEDFEEILKGFIESLCHVKEITIGFLCKQALLRLKAKGFIFPSNMKFLDVTDSHSDLDEWDY